MSRRSSFSVAARVLATLSHLLWSPSLWKTLYLLQTHLVASAKSGVVPGVHYSQDAEDIALVEFLEEDGFYVDVGAHHPERFSVTKLLYDRGWRGINIDVTPAITSEFPKRRPRDTNVQAVVGKKGAVNFFRFQEEALNTADHVRAEMLIQEGEKLSAQFSIDAVPLTELLTENGSPKRIDLLNVDVEGADLEVLESLDWEAFEVAAVLVEIGKPIWNLADDPVAQFLSERGMRPTLSFPRSVLFLERNHSANRFFRT